MNKKGFTLVELLATLGILSIVAGIAAIAYTSIVDNSKTKVFKTYEQTMYAETLSLLEEAVINPKSSFSFPRNGETKRIELTSLIDDYGMDPINNPRNKDDLCTDSYVEITRDDYQDISAGAYNDNINYKICLICKDSDYNVDGTNCLNIPEYDLSDNPVVQEINNIESQGACSKINWTDPDDGIIYFSGSNECINKNYVWYSGKMWRIVSIYPDGAMKLVTENDITTIAYNPASNTTFYLSYIYNWLNEDFYSTLYNASKIIDINKSWNVTSVSNSTDKPIDTTKVTARVGLLNTFDYYNSFRCNGNSACNGSNYSTGFLNNGYYWWLINNKSTNIWYVTSQGVSTNSITIRPNGVRPSIVIKPRVKLTGAGTINNPYKIVGDKETGKPNDYINTRLSGEYVKLKSSDGTNEQLFRIVTVEDNTTKIISMDYADNRNTRQYSTNSVNGVLWGSGTTLSADTWYTYLNNIYYPDMVDKYGDIFDEMVYYLDECSYNYKSCVCASGASGTIKNCVKTSKQKSLKVGLPLYGEMFSAQQNGGSANSCEMWTISANNNRNIWSIGDNNSAGNIGSEAKRCGKPTLHLESRVQINRGSGTINDPYEVWLDVG